MREDKILTLMGGGTDSTALTQYFLARGYEVHGLHYDYGQPAAQAEKCSVRAIAEYYGFEVEFHDLSVPIRRVGYEFVCRNSLLVIAAAASFGSDYKWIGLGIHKGTSYYDCTSAFARHMQLLLDGYFYGSVQLQAPFVDLSKHDILDYCHDEEIPIHLTFSCEIGPKTPCGECPSCRERFHHGVR